MKKALLASLAASLFVTAPAWADTTFALVKANGAVLAGDVVQKGRENNIECRTFEFEVGSAQSGGIATGRRSYKPIKCVKRVDKSSPLLVKALTTNQVIEATFKVFRGEGNFYTVSINQGRIANIRQYNAPDGTLVEEVSFTFSAISWTISDGNISHSDTGATP